MMSPQTEIQMIAILVSMACALPGNFLLLRQMSMLSDAITHTILLGIVLAFLLVGDLSSPWLLLGATLMGVLTVCLIQGLASTRLLSADSSIGIVFPLLFSLAIILITSKAGSIHLDTDSVLLGELAFAPFNRLVINGVDLGAKALYSSLALLTVNLVFISLFFKELKLATFDPMLSALAGFSPLIMHYGMMILASLTAVGSFQAVGSVLVVAFMIAPPATAYLLTDDLKTMLILSCACGALAGLGGYQLAVWLDVSIAGAMAVCSGLIFFLVLICSPRYGLIRGAVLRRQQAAEFAAHTLLLHIKSSSEQQPGPISLSVVLRNFSSQQKRFARAAQQLHEQGLIHLQQDSLVLTPLGREKCLAIEHSLFA